MSRRADVGAVSSPAPDGRLRRAARLLADPAEVRALARAQAALLAAQVQVWRQPVGQLVSPDAGTPAVPADRQPVAMPPEARRLGRAVARAARYGLIRPTCLARAIALHRLLERAGIAGSYVRVGVQVADGRFAAHAWVELHGAVVGEPRRVRRAYTSLGVMRLGPR